MKTSSCRFQSTHYASFFLSSRSFQNLSKQIHLNRIGAKCRRFQNQVVKAHRALGYSRSIPSHTDHFSVDRNYFSMELSTLATEAYAGADEFCHFSFTSG